MVWLNKGVQAPYAATVGGGGGLHKEIARSGLQCCRIRQRVLGLQRSEEPGWVPLLSPLGKSVVKNQGRKEDRFARAQVRGQVSSRLVLGKIRS